MNTRPLISLLLAALAAGAGYWFGARHEASTPAPTATAEKKPLYYRNPMGLADTSPVPKKDSMGMDYIPVYAGDEPQQDDGAIAISTAKVQKLGVRTEPVARRTMAAEVRAAGRIEADERRLFAVAPRFEGWVEKLHVNATGQAVAKGQPLFEVYAPELISAQREYAIAAQGVQALKDAAPENRAAMQRMADAALARLRNWEISPEQIQALAAGGEGRRTLTFRSPVAGVVTEKKALQGQRFMPGDALYQVADLSAVWVLADVFEQDLAKVKVGGEARIAVNAFPDRGFSGRIAYVYPTLKTETRSVPVRIELANPGGLLKPGMYAQVSLTQPATAPVLAVPASAIIDSGRRQVVFVQTGEGHFAPREVKPGRRDGDFVEILDGLAEGDGVVVGANFLIDAESNLKSALAGVTGPTSPASPPASGVGHKAVGTLESIDAKTGVVTIHHEPVASLKWPAMTMEFVAANPALFAYRKPGSKIAFEFVERKPGEWVVTQVTDR